MSSSVNQGPKKKPGWMSIPGGPKEPRFEDFMSKVQVLNAEKSKMFDKIKELNERIGTRDSSSPVDIERAELRSRMDVIRKQQDEERNASKEKRDSIQSIRGRKQDAERQLRELTAELGAFSSVEEIDKAIDHVMLKLETGRGSLAEERRTAQRLTKLEKAKGLLLNLQPMQDAIEEAEIKERELQQEFREIADRVKQLSKDFAETLEQKKAVDSANNSTFEQRKALMDERKKYSTRIDEIREKTTALREEFDGQRKEWDAWKEVAQQKFKEKMDAERAERDRIYNERREAARNERKKDKIALRRNPHAKEIDVCSVLTRYLKDKVLMNKRDEEERLRRDQRTAEFNPLTCAPEGFKLAKPTIEEICVGPKKTSKKKKDKEKERAKAAAVATGEAEKKPTGMTHPAEKARLFVLLGVAAPSSTAECEKAIAEISAKQKEFESHIISGPVDVSSSEEDVEEVAPVENAPAAE